MIDKRIMNNDVEDKFEATLFSVDERWKMFGCNNRKEFIKSYVIKGRFNSFVPDDVKKSYETVEYLMAHSYYHWNLYDEALKKLLLTLEMSIKFRCKALGIKLKKPPNSKGVEYDIHLSVLIKELAKQIDIEKRINQIEHFRSLRNHFSHPKQYSFGGGMMKLHIIPIINCINDLFDQEERSPKKKEDLLEYVDTDFRAALEYNGKRFLISSCTQIDQENDNFLIGFEAVLKVAGRESLKNIIPHFHFFRIKRVERKGCLTVFISSNDELIIVTNELSVDEKNEVEAYSKLKENKNDILFYNTSISNVIAKEIELFRYENII